MKTTTNPGATKMVSCMIDWTDCRCPDGCCGHKELFITSPKTGAVLALTHYDLPGALYARLPEINKPAAHSAWERGQKDESKLPATHFEGLFAFSVDELVALAKVGRVSKAAAS